MSEELLPCPFCGGEAERYDDHDTGSFNEGMSCIQCKRCGASSAMHGDRKENLLASWNERCSQGGQADVRQDGLLSLREQFIEGKQDWRIVRIYPERCVVLQSFGADRIKAEEAFRAASQAPSEASGGVEEYNRGARDGWMRCGVFHVDIDFEGRPEEQEAINRRWPLASHAPSEASSGVEVWSVRRQENPEVDDEYPPENYFEVLRPDGAWQAVVAVNHDDARNCIKAEWAESQPQPPPPSASQASCTPPENAITKTEIERLRAGLQEIVDAIEPGYGGTIGAIRRRAMAALSREEGSEV